MDPATEKAVREKLITAYQGQDTADLLQNIAWTDVVRPKLLKEREQYQQLLVQAVLGTEPTITDNNGVVHRITKEQLAGRINGLDYVIAMLEGILKKGDKAVAELRSFGLNV